MAGDFGSSYPPYRWTAQLTNFSGGTLQQLDVTVLWRQRDLEQSVVLSTIVTNTDTTGTTGATGTRSP
jgi:hypothetical protein